MTEKLSVDLCQLVNGHLNSVWGKQFNLWVGVSKVLKVWAVR